MAAKICTHCGYEGTGKKVTAGGGGAMRVLGIVTMLPFHTLWKIFSRRATNQCPNCQLPTLVKQESVEGRLARRKFDVELGLVAATPGAEQKVEKQAPAREVFGNERPGEGWVKRDVDPEKW